MATLAKAVKLIDKMMLIHAALADPELSKADVTVLAILIEATNKLKGYAWASIETISYVANIKRRYAQRIIKRLEKMGYVRVVLGGRGPKDTNRYFPNFQGRPSRPPLAIPKAIPRTAVKGGQFVQKDGLAGSEGRPSRPPDTSYVPTDLETLLPKAPQQAAAPRKKEFQQRRVWRKKPPRSSASSKQACSVESSTPTRRKGGANGSKSLSSSQSPYR